MDNNRPRIPARVPSVTTAQAGMLAPTARADSKAWQELAAEVEVRQIVAAVAGALQAVVAVAGNSRAQVPLVSNPV